MNEDLFITLHFTAKTLRCALSNNYAELLKKIMYQLGKAKINEGCETDDDIFHKDF